jgi:hypothetical protein
MWRTGKTERDEDVVTTEDMCFKNNIMRLSSVSFDTEINALHFVVGTIA